MQLHGTDEMLWVEGVRGFFDGQWIPIRPLTVLVGENSSGKSTLLALNRIAWETTGPYQVPQFNDEPFYLGSYEEIASFRGGKGGRAPYFGVGVSRNAPSDHRGRIDLSSLGRLALVTEFASGATQPEPTRRRLYAGEFSLQINWLRDAGQVEVVASGPSGKMVQVIAIPEDRFAVAYGNRIASEMLVSTRGDEATLFPNLVTGQEDSLSGDDREIIRAMLAASFNWAHEPRPYAVAPIRTQPLRTYDPVVVQSESQGGHVPLMLAKWAMTGGNKQSERVFAALEQFGKASGLFQRLEVKRFGRTDSSPFQLRVAVGKAKMNLIDVGYGVSQVLPIIVEAALGRRRKILLQQPEVHLHPRAQAELASFLASVVNPHRSFVIETHSDHFIDRIRMDIRDGRGIRADQVLILYVERQGRESLVHPIEIDSEGNLIDVPSSYRNFFHREEMRLLGGE